MYNDNLEAMDGKSYHCSLCSYSTGIESLYERHVAKHALVAPYLCTSCSYSDVDHGSFVDHMMTHQQGRVLRCNFCNYKSIATSMRVHLLKHRTVDMLDCSMCEFSTNYSSAMKSHVEVYHTREYVCNYCENVMTKYSLIKHSWNVHGVLIKTKLKSLNELGYGLADDPVNNESKIKLEATVKSEPEFDIDLKEEEPDQDERSASGMKPDLKEEEPDRDERSASEIKPAQPRCHKWVGKFDCEFCEFTTKYYTSKKIHIEKIHTKLFTCGHCESVMTKHDLAAHYRDVHAKDLNLKHKTRLIEVSSDMQTTKTQEESSSSVECTGPSIIEAVKSASRKPNRKFGFVGDGKPSCEVQTSTPDGSVTNSPLKPGTQETSGELSSTACEPVAPFVLSIAEAVKSKTRKAKRKSSSAPDDSPALDPRCAKSSYLQTSDVDAAIGENSHAQEIPSLKPEISGAAENRTGYLYCSKCKYKTRLKSLMRNHAASHLPECHLVCPKCNFSCDVNYKFARHLKSHSSGGLLNCCFCTYSTAVKGLKNLSRHLGSHKKVGTFFCSKCSYSCAVRKCLKAHLRVHHSEKCQCPGCPKIGTKFRILKHMKECHPGIDEKPVIVDVSKVKVNNKEETLCKIEQNSTSDVLNRISDAGSCTPGIVTASASTEFSAVDIPDRPTDQNHQAHITVDTSALVESSTSLDPKPNLYCSECPYNTRKKPLLRRHVAKHLLEGSFFHCPECHLKENNPYEFVFHLKTHEMNLAACCYCGYEFRSAKGIERAYADHLELHRPVHFIDCPNCEKTFKRLGDLRNHFYTNHISKRRCPDCDKPMTRYKLLRHLAKHRCARKRNTGHAPKTSNPTHAQYGADLGTGLDGLFVDGIVGDCFSVPLSPDSRSNSGSLAKPQDSVFPNTHDTFDASEYQGMARAEDFMSSEYVLNPVAYCSGDEFEDPTNVPIFDISEAPLSSSRSARTPKHVVAPDQNAKKVETNIPTLWDTLGIDVFNFSRDSKNDECGSDTTLTGDDSDIDGITTSSGRVAHFLDHNYAANSTTRRNEF